MGKRKAPRRKAMRKGMLRVFSKQTVNTGQGPAPLAVREYQNRLRTFNQEIPRTLGMLLPSEDKVLTYKNQVLKKEVDNVPRDEVEELLRNMRNMLEGVPVERHIRLAFGKNYKLFLFFSNDHKRWFFVEWKRRAANFRRSIVYSSKERALAVFKIDSVVWVQNVEVPPNLNVAIQAAINPPS